MAATVAAVGEQATLVVGKDGFGNGIIYSATVTGKLEGTKALLASTIPPVAKKGGGACPGTIGMRPELARPLTASAAVCCAFLLAEGTLW